MSFWTFPPVGSHGDDVSAFEFTLMRGASVFVSWVLLEWKEVSREFYQSR
jgi:hypothetical protein